MNTIKFKKKYTNNTQLSTIKRNNNYQNSFIINMLIRINNERLEIDLKCYLKLSPCPLER